MAKISRTKTHVKIYLTPKEFDALDMLINEGAAGLLDDQDPIEETPAMKRVHRIVGSARRLADEITAIAKARGE